MKHTKRTLKAQPKGLWMYLPEENRIKLVKLATIQGASGRALAKAAGWRSHTYMQRLMRGEVRTLDPGPAAGIAHHLGVGVDDLFLVKRTSNLGDSHKSSDTPARPIRDAQKTAARRPSIRRRKAS